MRNIFRTLGNPLGALLNFDDWRCLSDSKIIAPFFLKLVGNFALFNVVSHDNNVASSSARERALIVGELSRIRSLDLFSALPWFSSERVIKFLFTQNS